MATLKHIASKNSDYTAIEAYLVYQHDAFTGKQLLDEQGKPKLRDSYLLDTLECGDFSFATACLLANRKYGKNTRRQNEITMAAANAIKSKRIIELTSGEAGIVNHTDKVYLLDWMQTYLEYQEKRDKKGIGQIKAVTHILKEYAGERFLLDRVDLAFCQGYIDYMLTTFRPKGKPIAASTRNTYYQIFNGALNTAVRAKRLLRNPFNEMEKSEKPKMPESVRSYMTIEEVRALIATPVQDGRVKNAYLFSCFCGLRISDIVGLKWKNVFVDNGQYRLAVAMQKTKEPIYLPLSNEALKWMPEREDKAADDHVFSLPSNINQYLKPWAEAAAYY